MKITLFATASIALVFFCSESKGQSMNNIVYSTDFNLPYSSDFNSPDYTAGQPINGQAGWGSTSANNPGPGAIEALNLNDGTTIQTNSFVLGAASVDSTTPNYSTYPTEQSTTIYHAADTGFNGVGIKSEFSLNYSSGPQDTFGYSIVSTTGYDLMNILFTPTTLSVGVMAYQIGVQSEGGNNNNPIQYLQNQQGQQLLVLTNQFYNAQFYISGIGTANQSISLYTYQDGTTNSYGTTLLNNSDFSSNAPYNDGNTNVGYVGMTWNIQDSSTNANGVLTNFGSNSMIVQNITVYGVPEPKTWILFGISGLVIVVALRRRA